MVLTPFLVELPSFWQTIRMALRLDPEIYALVQSSRDGLVLALWVVVLAALSETIGQSVVLLINRVRPRRFVLAVVISVLSHLIGYLLWSTVIWLAVWFVFAVRVPFIAALAIVGLAYAPQLLAFFEVAPYLGNFFGLVLTLWSMAAIVVAVRSGMGLSLWQAAVTGLVSWFVIQIWRRSIGRPIYALGRAIERRAAGAKLEYSVDDAVQGKLHRETYSKNWSAWVQQQREALRSHSAPSRSHTTPPRSADKKSRSQTRAQPENQPAREPRALEAKPADLAALEQARLHAPAREPVPLRQPEADGPPHD